MNVQILIVPWREKTCQTNLNVGASMTSKPVFGVSDKVTARILARNLKFCS